MRSRVILILICSSVLLVLFQNFSVPTRVLPIRKKFESNAVDPAKRFRDLVKHEVGEGAFSRLEELKSKLKIEWGRDPASSSEPEVEPVVEQDKNIDPLKYSFANLRTVRVKDGDSELNCRVEAHGLNLSFQQRLSSNASYVIEHNTEQQKSHAKFQLSW